MINAFLIWHISFMSFFFGPTESQFIDSITFEFEYNQKTLRGLIEKPNSIDPQALILIIPGYGATNFVHGGSYSTLRRHFVEAGLTVVVWDKMGCGDSEGTFDANQPVESSAEEALAAIAKLKEMDVPGSEKIGLWGVSRGGWICPLLIQQYPIKFWISVSGVDDKENFGYLLRSNLIIHGRSEEEADRLHKAWLAGHKAFSTKGSLESYLEAIKPLREDKMCQELFGYNPGGEITDEDRESFRQEQKTFTSKGSFDEESGLWAYIEDFDQLISAIQCPVLALFGANDSQVDWRKTKRLYEHSLGQNQGNRLTTKVFENCNHNIQKCITCAWKEDLSSLQWQTCDGYYETMKDWLLKNNIVE